MLRISWLFCIFRYSPENEVWQPKRGKYSNQDMAKVQNISEIHPTLGFTEFDILEKYRKSFNESELGRLHSVFPFERMAKALGLSEQRLGRRNIFSPAAKIALMVLKAYTGFSDRQLVEHLNGNIHYQMFCGIMIDPSFPITNYKIVSAIRNEMASRLDIESLQEVLASHWKPYLENLHVCMTDATCYESHMRFPTDMKLLFEGRKVSDRIVSIDRHYVRPIVRGKETKSVEFGAKVNNIQIDGISFIEHLSFKAFNEGIRLKDCIRMQQKLMNVRVRCVAADSIYANNANRKFCTKYGISTSFVRKGRAARDEFLRKVLRSELSRERATRLEGSFGTQKQHYSLSRIRARNRKTEILWIFFGIHTANAVLMIDRIRNRTVKAA